MSRPLFKEYYEPIGQKPLIHGMVIEANKRRFRVIRWFFSGGHCFEFEDIGETPIENFCRKPSEVVKAIKEKRIRIIANPNSEIK